MPPIVRGFCPHKYLLASSSAWIENFKKTAEMPFVAYGLATGDRVLIFKIFYLSLSVLNHIHTIDQSITFNRWLVVLVSILDNSLSPLKVLDTLSPVLVVFLKLIILCISLWVLISTCMRIPRCSHYFFNATNAFSCETLILLGIRLLISLRFSVGIRRRALVDTQYKTCASSLCAAEPSPSFDSPYF